MPPKCLPILQSKIPFCHFLGQHVSSQHEECYATGNQPYAWLVPSALSYLPSSFNQFREKINWYIFSTWMRWKNIRLVHLVAVDTRVLLPILTTISEHFFKATKLLNCLPALDRVLFLYITVQASLNFCLTCRQTSSNAYA